MAKANPPLHRSAKTTRAQRRGIQRSPETDTAIAKKLGINRSTVAKWRVRDSVEDLPMGPKAPRLGALSEEHKMLLVALRQLTWGSLERLHTHSASGFPSLSRSALYRIWDKWEVSRTPRGAKRPNFPFLYQADNSPAEPEPFHLCAFKFRPDAERGMMFVIGERSGALYAEPFDVIDGKHAYQFMKIALQNLAESETPSSISQLTTPVNWAFCNENDPDDWHRFRQKCHSLGIKQVLATNAPAPIAALQKGWPGGKSHPKRRKRRKTVDMIKSATY